MLEMLLKYFGTVGCHALALFMLFYGVTVAVLAAVALINLIKKYNCLISFLGLLYFISIAIINYAALDIDKLMPSDNISLSVIMILAASLFLLGPVAREILKNW